MTPVKSPPKKAPAKAKPSSLEGGADAAPSNVIKVEKPTAKKPVDMIKLQKGILFTSMSWPNMVDQFENQRTTLEEIAKGQRVEEAMQRREARRRKKPPTDIDMQSAARGDKPISGQAKIDTLKGEPNPLNEQLGEITSDVGANITSTHAELAPETPAASTTQPSQPSPETAQAETQASSEGTTQDENLIHTAYRKRAVELLLKLVSVNWKDLKSFNMEALLKGKNAGLTHFMDALIMANVDLSPESAGQEYALGILERSNDPQAQPLIVKLRAQVGSGGQLSKMAKESGMEQLTEKLENPDLTPEQRAQAVDESIKTTIEQNNFQTLGTLLGKLTNGRLSTKEVVDPHSGTKYMLPDTAGWIGTLNLPENQNPEELAQKMQQLVIAARKVGLKEKAKGVAGTSLMSLLALLAALSMSMQVVGATEEGK